jgi:hypothetical protein
MEPSIAQVGLYTRFSYAQLVKGMSQFQRKKVRFSPSHPALREDLSNSRFGRLSRNCTGIARGDWLAMTPAAVFSTLLDYSKSIERRLSASGERKSRSWENFTDAPPQR